MTVKTVNSGFDIFVKDFVDLDKNKTTKARSSRDWLYDQLKSFPSSVENFPKLYGGKETKGFGSFRRRTKIRPLDDIDFLLVFSGEGTTYTEYSVDDIELSVPESAEKLRKLCNDDNTLNSIKVVEKLKKSLSNIPQYQKSEIHRRQEAATLKMTSYDWNFDIVPAFITSEDSQGRTYYIIPNGSGKWKKTDPRIDNERTKDVNQSFSGNVLGFIRLIKYWNINSSAPKISSYLMENIVLDYFDGKYSWLGRKQEISDFFWDLKTSIFNSHHDPKRIQGDLNTLDYEVKIKISDQAGNCYDYACEAIELENQGKHKDAVEKWRKLFGIEFPAYEE
ncbi:nucleotidyltransferase [Virgibacillus dokdonensis]|uniref:Nucleotidyltransferase n=1 Tax=Virgibacillus dokdonensis TaxID=302167 RepID=A0A3E0WJS6_9BACI|nr:nucleotidyltransferase [Virgibacillus dokdonensis]RFA32463.1 nucleotidyltransferase [Virgibacillus dokdonensis]